MTKSVSLVDQLPLGLLSALMVGGATAFFVFAMPTMLVERAVAMSGIASLVAAASPPLGGTARMILVAMAGGTTGAIAWLTVSFVGGGRASWPRPVERPFIWEDPEEEIDPATLRRADLYADASPRKPLFASDLGAPINFEEPAVAENQPVEDDPVYADWSEVEETQEYFDFAPPLPPIAIVEEGVAVAVPKREIRGDEPITALMERLESGLARRAVRPATAPLTGNVDAALRTALADLKRMAAR